MLGAAAGAGKCSGDSKRLGRGGQVGTISVARLPLLRSEEPGVLVGE
jgi:hypothetical protein